MLLIHLLVRTSPGDSTPLMEAASGGYADIVKLLIDHGANVNATSRYNYIINPCIHVHVTVHVHMYTCKIVHCT